MAEGTITELRGSYGFIRPSEGRDKVFFHRSVLENVQFNELREGMAVEYEMERGDRGPRATVVRLSGTRREDGYRFLNPYNFVRPLDKPRRENHVLGDCTPPPHDRYVDGLLTGRITCTVTAKTPLFISDSHAVEVSPNQHKTFRFFECEGKPAIPASSLRGMIRSMFEAITNSCFTVLSDKKLSKHVASGNANRLVPARVEKVNGEFMLRLLPGTNQANPAGLPRGAPQYAAWIKLYSPMRGNLTAMANPDSPYAERSMLSLPSGMRHGSPCAVIVDRMNHPPRRTRSGRMFGQFSFWNVVHIAASRGALPRSQPGQKVVDGWLCVTNQNIENKHDERVFFADGNARLLPLDESVVEDYEDLIEDYQDRHRDDIEKRRKRGQPISEPIPGSRKDAGLSRFIVDQQERYMRDGALVYAMLTGTSESLSVGFIAPVSIPRVGYGQSIGDRLDPGVPSMRSYLHKCRCYDQLCPACRLFGWVYGTGDPKEPKLEANERSAYAGRIRLTHATPVDGKVQQRRQPSILSILSTPKPTTTQFYLLKNNKPDGYVDYDDPGARLRGRKFYRHHGDEPSKHRNGYEYERVGGTSDDQNRTVHGVVEKGSLFEFELEFENLHSLELGALLWALELEPRMNHRLGYGKPLGLGSVKLDVTGVELLEPQTRYSDLSSAGWKHPIDKGAFLKVYTDLFNEAMCIQYGAAFKDLLKELKALLSDPCLDAIHYPRQDPEPTEEGENFKWFVGNKRRDEPIPLDLSADDAGLLLMDERGQIRH